MKCRLDLVCFLALALAEEARAARWERQERERRQLNLRGISTGLWDAMHRHGRWQLRANLELKARGTFGRTSTGRPRQRRDWPETEPAEGQLTDERTTMESRHEVLFASLRDLLYELKKQEDAADEAYDQAARDNDTTLGFQDGRRRTLGWVRENLYTLLEAADEVTA